MVCEQINESLVEVTEVSKGLTLGAEQVLDNSKQLQGTATELNKIVAHFKV